MKTAVSFALLLAALGLSVATVSTASSTGVKPEDVGLSSERLQRISQMIARRIAAGEIAGAVTIVARKGKVAHLSAQGVMDLESKQPMTPASHVPHRVDDQARRRRRDHDDGRGGQAAPERPGVALHSRVPRHEGRRRAAAAARPRRRPRKRRPEPQFYTVPAQREITIKDLLTHVSGLGSGPMGNSGIEKVARKDGEKLSDYIPRLGTTALEFQPGSRWTYSPGAGFETLGRIVEIASGLPLDQFFRTRIFDPLGMKDITFWPIDAQWKRVATVYARTPSGLTKTVQANDTLSRNVYFRGSGGLFSTAADYVPLGMMLANGGELNGKRLLSRKTVEMMSAAHVPDTLPGRPAGEGYGLSVRVVTNHAARGTMLSDGTFGWTGAQGTHFFVDPKEQLVGVLMVQTTIQEMQREFEDLVAQSVND